MDKKIGKILFWAFVVRLILLLFQYNIGNLPHAGADSVRFERYAYEISSGNTNVSLIDVLTVRNAYLHCFLGAGIYSIFGRVPVIWALLHLLMGLIVIYNIYRSVSIATGSKHLAGRSAWIAAFFPNLAIFSVILLREIYILFFISFAVLSLMKYLKNNRAVDLIQFLIWGIVAAIFHSAVFSIIFGFIIYITLFNKKANLFAKLFILLVAASGLLYINFSGIGLAKFGGSFDEAIDMAMSEQVLIEEAGSNYPNWMVLQGGASGFLLLPIRMIAFYFAPLIPFMVRSLHHAIGIIDSAFYILIFYNIISMWGIHKKSEFSKSILVMVFVFTIAFSFGASNFGTNIRHRTKILPVLLSVPLISKREKKVLRILQNK